jgi:hypothetical protein
LASSGRVQRAPGLDLDVLGLAHVLQDGDGVAGELQDAGQLAEGPVELRWGCMRMRDIGHAPEVLGVPDVGEDDKGDESVGVGLGLDKLGIDEQVESRRRSTPR